MTVILLIKRGGVLIIIADEILMGVYTVSKQTEVTIITDVVSDPNNAGSSLLLN